MSSALQVQIQTLELKQAFKIAHGSTKHRQILRLKWDDAVGEAPFVPYYPDQPEAVLNWLEELQWQGGASPPEGPKVGRLALDILWNDHQAKRKQVPLHVHLGTSHPNGLHRSYRSVGLEDQISEILDRIEVHLQSFDRIKLKLGSGEVEFDEELVAKTREHFPSLKFCADVNGGWTPQETLKMLPRLAKWRLSFLEQPVSPQGGPDLWEEVHRKRTSTEIPIFADESLQSVEDISLLSPWIQGANIKLLKAGSLTQAKGMIEKARAFRLGVMMGCMVESSLGITCAAHLSALVDEVDLDGALYLSDDDYCGVVFGPQGSLVLPSGAGIGGHWKSPS